MNQKNLFIGIGIGMAAGAAVGMIIAPKKKSPCGVAGKLLKSAGNVLESVSSTLGI